MALGLLLFNWPEGNVDSGFYAACAGLRAQSQALEVVGHNLANVNTVGYRGDQTTFQSLLAVSHPTVPNVLNLATNNFGVLEGTHMDESAGNLRNTGNPLDVGIEGDGFFVIQTTRGTRYTRNGSFQVSKSGTLVTASGDPVYGDPALKPKGLINVPPGAVSIASDGTISVNGAVTGTIRLEEFPPGTTLTAEGGSLLAAPAGAGQLAQHSRLRQGTLESSNVNPITSVVALLSVQRQAEMLQRALSLFDTALNQIASNTLSRV
jgi:flagellar basal-body rod protein FlgF/flagellar basal-body rod protein FlgG